MQTQSLKNEEKHVPQFKVRTDLRSGNMDACSNAITSWKTSYDKWYLQAINDGKINAPTA